MTSRKVKKYIKAQHKARRRAQRGPAGAGTSQTHQPEDVAGAEPQGARHAAPPQTDRAGRAARAVAATVGLTLVAAAAGSAAVGLTGDDEERTVLLEPHAVAGPEVTERVVCPAVPGRPDSLSDQGVLEYAERDDSAASSTFAAVFAARNGDFPAADWFALDDEGRGEAESMITSGEHEEDSAGPLADRPLISGEFDADGGLPLLEVEPLAGRSPSRAAVSAAGFSYSADSGPVTGLSSGMCEAPARSQWYLGPETGAGAHSLLTLANPHSRDATAEVTTYDAEGETGALGTTAVLVPPHTVRTVNLAGLVEADSQIAVHVQASSAPLAGHLQSARSTGGTGLGVEMLPALPGPLYEHIALAVPAGAEEDPQMWLYAPEDEPVTVELQVFGPEGQVETDTPGVFTLEPGSVSTAGLHGLPAGTYDVVLTTDHPTFAAVRSSGDGQPVTVEVDLEPEIDPITGLPGEPETQEEESDPLPDFSWSAAAQTLAAGSGALLPQGYQSDLRLFSPPGEGQAELSYRLFDSAGARTEDLVQEIAPGTSVDVAYEELVDQARSAGLEDLSAVVITSVEGDIFGGALIRDDVGSFSITELGPISPSAQHVPLRIEP